MSELRRSAGSAQTAPQVSGVGPRLHERILGLLPRFAGRCGSPSGRCGARSSWASRTSTRRCSTGAATTRRSSGRALRDRPPGGSDRLQVRPRESRLPAAQDQRDGRPETIRRHCDGSLARLGIEYLDLYYLHRVDPDVPVEESFGALGQLVAEGKVRRLGISECTRRRARARARHASGERAAERVLAVDARAAGGRDPVVRRERRVLRRLRRARAGLPDRRAACGPGVPGRATSAPGTPRFQPDAMRANAAIVDGVRRVAERLGRNAGPGLRGLGAGARASTCCPIPGTKRERPTSRRTWAARPSSWTPRRWPSSTRCRPRSARATPESRDDLRLTARGGADYPTSPGTSGRDTETTSASCGADMPPRSIGGAATSCAHPLTRSRS